MILGIDIGSISTKTVLLDDGLALLGDWEERNAGRPADAFRRLMRSAFGESRDHRLKVGLTGTELATERTKLEAFVYQVKQSAGRRRKAKGD